MIPTLDQRLRLRDVPPQPAVMYQKWEQLLFLHWGFEPAEIQKTLPTGLTADTFDGEAWVGIVPFLMRGIRPRFLPAVSKISNFLELNLRTYVHDAQGRPGVWFYSLECNQPLAVQIARSLFHLPYQHARMNTAIQPSGMRKYASQRKKDEVVSKFHYQIADDSHEATPGGLEFHLAERYLLFSKSPNGLRMGRVHHQPYPLAPASLQKWDARLFALNGLPVPSRPPDHVMGSAGVQVKVYPLQSLGL